MTSKLEYFKNFFTMQAKKDKWFPYGKYIILYPDASDINWQQNVTEKYRNIDHYTNWLSLHLKIFPIVDTQYIISCIYEAMKIVHLS